MNQITRVHTSPHTISPSSMRKISLSPFFQNNLGFSEHAVILPGTQNGKTTEYDLNQHPFGLWDTYYPSISTTYFHSGTLSISSNIGIPSTPVYSWPQSARACTFSSRDTRRASVFPIAKGQPRQVTYTLCASISFPRKQQCLPESCEDKIRWLGTTSDTKHQCTHANWYNCLDYCQHVYSHSPVFLL